MACPPQVRAAKEAGARPCGRSRAERRGARPPDPLLAGRRGRRLPRVRQRRHLLAVLHGQRRRRRRGAPRGAAACAGPACHVCALRRVRSAAAADAAVLVKRALRCTGRADRQRVAAARARAGSVLARAAVCADACVGAVRRRTHPQARRRWRRRWRALRPASLPRQACPGTPAGLALCIQKKGTGPPDHRAPAGGRHMGGT